MYVACTCHAPCEISIDYTVHLYVDVLFSQCHVADHTNSQYMVADKRSPLRLLASKNKDNARSTETAESSGGDTNKAHLPASMCAFYNTRTTVYKCHFTLCKCSNSVLYANCMRISPVHVHDRCGSRQVPEGVQ